MDPLATISAALHKEQIIPDVLPPTFTPSVLFSIFYPNGSQVNLGNELTVDETQDEPEITLAALNPWAAPDSDSESSSELSYTLAMLDPDAPYRQDAIYRSFRHWVVTGLRLRAPAANVGEAAEALKTHPAATPYRPPGPRPNSGVHRYTFLLFEEPPAAGGEPFMVPQDAPERGVALEERRSWDALRFAEGHGLRLVGANYFLVRSEAADTDTAAATTMQ